jgi:hypothetical protein
VEPVPGSVERDAEVSSSVVRLPDDALADAPS